MSPRLSHGSCPTWRDHRWNPEAEYLRCEDCGILGHETTDDYGRDVELPLYCEQCGAWASVMQAGVPLCNRHKEKPKPGVKKCLKCGDWFDAAHGWETLCYPCWRETKR